jgi:hypothetical protein
VHAVFVVRVVSAGSPAVWVGSRVLEHFSDDSRKVGGCVCVFSWYMVPLARVAHAERRFEGVRFHWALPCMIGSSHGCMQRGDRVPADNGQGSRST